MSGRIFSVNIGRNKGEPKDMVLSALLKKDHGFDGDAHAGLSLRQVSLLAIEEVEKLEDSLEGRDIDFRPGIFAENITTEGLDLSNVKADDKINIGSDVVLKVTQIGKECHTGCSILRQAGRCLMPKSGIFAQVEKGGMVRVGDRIALQKQKSFSLSRLRPGMNAKEGCGGMSLDGQTR